MCVCVSVCKHIVCVCAYVRVCKYRYGMLQSTPIPPCQYLLSILRFEERELVSIFMDVVKHEILAVFPNPVSVCAHTHTDREKSERKPPSAWIQSSNGVY